MPRNRSVASLILTVIFVVLAVITLPGFFSYFYRAGVGQALFEIVQSENVQWDTLSDAERAAYGARSEAEGLKCAVLMILGEHIPFLLLILITIALLTRSISRGFRRFLRLAFFGVWILGLLFLSFGVGYWGQAPQFPESLSCVLLIYLVVLGLFGMILGIGKLIQATSRKQAVEPPPVGQGEQ